MFADQTSPADETNPAGDEEGLEEEEEEEEEDELEPAWLGMTREQYKAAEMLASEMTKRSDYFYDEKEQDHAIKHVIFAAWGKHTYLLQEREENTAESGDTRHKAQQHLHSQHSSTATAST